MATPSLMLINALRETAQKLKNGASYAWGNHGSCNCGHLLQSITNFSSEEILEYAHQGIGEWTEIAKEYCGITNLPVDFLLRKLQDYGLTPSDIHDVEYLTNRKVLNQLPGGFKWLKRNDRNDVILYFETFAQLLEEELLSNLNKKEPKILKNSNLLIESL